MAAVAAVAATSAIGAREASLDEARGVPVVGLLLLAAQPLSLPSTVFGRRSFLSFLLFLLFFDSARCRPKKL